MPVEPFGAYKRDDWVKVDEETFQSWWQKGKKKEEGFVGMLDTTPDPPVGRIFRGPQPDGFNEASLEEKSEIYKKNQVAHIVYEFMNSPAECYMTQELLDEVAPCN